MTGLLHWRVQRITALINLFYGLYLILVPYLGLPFNINSLLHESLLTILFLSILTHVRLGMWAVVTDYVPNIYQQVLLRIIDFYLVFMVIWGIIIVW